jgi:protein phosphatase 1 regulatory subunit 37
MQDVGVAHLCDGLCDQTGEKGLCTLVLFNNQLTYQAMSSLAKVLVATNHLRSLNVGHNAVTNEGIHRLKESLLMNKVLTNLSLQSARISCEGTCCTACSVHIFCLDVE